ncbi:MAG: hypothetical protein ACHQ5A_01885 [Opitutales bacterium]
MKHKQPQVGLKLVSAPAETNRDSVSERRSAAHLNDPSRRWQHPADAPDSRQRVEAGGAPQRNRARQTEARTAQLCHVRKQRRALPAVTTPPSV